MAQLDTALALRTNLAKKLGSFHPKARPIVTADEVDQIVRSPDRHKQTEQKFDSVLGMFDRHGVVSSFIAACAVRYRSIFLATLQSIK